MLPSPPKWPQAHTGATTPTYPSSPSPITCNDRHSMSSFDDSYIVFRRHGRGYLNFVGCGGSAELASRSWYSTTFKSTATITRPSSGSNADPKSQSNIHRLLYGRPLGTGQEILKAEDAVPAVKHWFPGREGQWLVVMDSADSIDNNQDRSYIDLRYFMPDALGVHIIIITSRSSTVQEMTLLEAIEIVKELGYLALAITLAGSYVSVTPRLSSHIRGYLPKYRRRRNELLRLRPKQQVHRYGESVSSIWEASFDAVAIQSPAAARLLGMLASMSFDDIFHRIFNPSVDGGSRQPDAALPPAPTWRSFFFPEGEWSLYQLESALEVLQRYAFIKWRVDQQSYSMHKLVHAWGQDRLDMNTQWRHRDVALELLADTTADSQLSPSYKLRLVPHLMTNLGVYLEIREWTRERTRDKAAFLDNIGGFLDAIGRWSEASEVQVLLVRKREEALGKEHPATLTSMNNLAVMLESQGNYDEAEQIHRQTLALRETVHSVTRFSSIS
ncbi:MAG: hypothetical protein Q9182_005761 [Xanthomendoza sp. 2 TL-2023]